MYDSHTDYGTDSHAFKTYPNCLDLIKICDATLVIHSKIRNHRKLKYIMVTTLYAKTFNQLDNVPSWLNNLSNNQYKGIAWSGKVRDRTILYLNHLFSTSIEVLDWGQLSFANFSSKSDTIYQVNTWIMNPTFLQLGTQSPIFRHLKMPSAHCPPKILLVPLKLTSRLMQFFRITERLKGPQLRTAEMVLLFPPNNYVPGTGSWYLVAGRMGWLIVGIFF